ncbi:hypothetical protein AJ80_08810 [Polytolypa hystricis UAMH7299]|uniref:Uncharacterized protein n=1 Tax=Polytolypa hystricis (strain UAMH7299) TaxID=1447883 RepID=A0A2B7X1M5_POLH7|nr:hypothetical protein AJ80_08810 [Polytolypa hystricis UAMH7299]
MSYQQQHPRIQIPRRTSSVTAASYHDLLSAKRSQEALLKLHNANNNGNHHPPSHHRTSTRQHPESRQERTSNTARANTTTTTKQRRKASETLVLTTNPEKILFPEANDLQGLRPPRSSLVPADNRLSQSDLRSRASSPLLGKSYQHNNSPLDSSFHAKLKPLRTSESAFALRSFFDPLGSPPAVSPELASPPSDSDLPLRNATTVAVTSGQSQTDLISPSGLNPLPLSTKDEGKSLKVKHRPPMIDLSKLFPKPKDAAAPLLSPHRMTSSPSPVSLRSESSFAKLSIFDRINSTGNKLTKQPRQKDVALRQPYHPPDPYSRQQQQQHAQQRREPQELQQGQWQHSSHPDVRFQQQQSPTCGEYANPKLSKKKSSHWFESSQANVSEDEVDIFPKEKRLANRSAQPSPQHRQKSQQYQSQGHSSSQRAVSRTSTTTTQKSSNTSPTWRSPQLSHPSPTPISPVANRLQTSISRWEGGDSSRSSSKTRGTLSKKSSKMLMNQSDLNEASVLCLSSSEDEDEDVSASRRKGAARNGRTYDHEKSERGSSKQSPISGTSRKPTPRRQPTRTSDANRSRTRGNSISSSVGSSNVGSYGSRVPSRPSSGIPTISEPDSSRTIRLPSSSNLDYHGSTDSPAPRSNTSSVHSSTTTTTTTTTTNRRSRFMAVTRQEEHLLELIRRNKGTIPNIMVEGDSGQQNTKKSQPDRSSIASLGVVGPDTSFLRLGPSSTSSRKSHNNHSSEPMVESEYAYTLSDAGGASDHSNISPRISLVHSDTMPSPSTSVTSPRTPTLPIHHHRLSPRNQHHPAITQFSPTVAGVIPSGDQHGHTRTRTDSSSAVVFGAEGDVGSGRGGKDGGSGETFPIWALGWNNEATEIAVVH